MPASSALQMPAPQDVSPTKINKPKLTLLDSDILHETNKHNCFQYNCIKIIKNFCYTINYILNS